MSSLFGDVNSTTNEIKFDANSDGTPELYLNSTGLGIGTTSVSSNLHVVGNTIIQNGQIVVGSSTSGNSTLEISGSIGFNVESISSNTLLSSNSTVLADTSSGNLTLTLPYAGNVTGRIYTIKKISQNNKLWVSGAGNIIDNLGSILELSAATAELPNLELISDGTQWFILSSSNNITTLSSDNLTAWWQFDETSGNTAYDSTANQNHAYLQNGFTFSSNSTVAKLGRALEFDGEDDWVTTPDLNLSSSFSIVFYMRLKGRGHGGTVDGSFATPISVNSGNRFLWEVSTGFLYSPALMSSSALSLNAWVHITYVFDKNASQEYFYIGGTQVATKATAAPTFDGTGFIGAYSASKSDVYNLYGSIDEIRIYNKVLNATEIKLLSDLY